MTIPKIHDGDMLQVFTAVELAGTAIECSPFEVAWGRTPQMGGEGCSHVEIHLVITSNGTTDDVDMTLLPCPEAVAANKNTEIARAADTIDCKKATTIKTFLVPWTVLGTGAVIKLTRSGSTDTFTVNGWIRRISHVV